MYYRLTDIKANKCTIVAFDGTVKIGELTNYGYSADGDFWAEISGNEVKIGEFQQDNTKAEFDIDKNQKKYILTDISLPTECYTNKITIYYDEIYSKNTTPIYNHKEINIINPQYNQSNVTKIQGEDPLYKYQWHLKNTGQDFGVIKATPKEDINVEPVWNEGITGKGVVVGVIDSGVDIFHPDLKDNILLDACYNYYNASHNTTPSGEVGIFDSNTTLSLDSAHGTAVAGIIAAKGWNGIGTRGVAPNAKIASLNALDNPLSIVQDPGISYISTQTERIYDALVRNLDKIDIYNNSWGGDATTLTDDENLSDYGFDKQLAYGVKHGRGGLGAVYVKSAGNEGEFSNANFNSIVTNGYFIVVGSLGADGKRANYSTPGSNILVSAPGGKEDIDLITKDKNLLIVTTDLPGNRRGLDREDKYATIQPHFNVAGNENYDYTNKMNGTSAAAPIVSGVVALMLEANPSLTYRDVQIILAKSARKNDPTNPEWRENAAGLHFNYYYGFGAVDAQKAVDLAKNWVSVGGYEDVKKVMELNNSALQGNEINLTFNVSQNITVEDTLVTLTLEGTPYVIEINKSNASFSVDKNAYEYQTVLLAGEKNIKIVNKSNESFILKISNEDESYIKTFTVPANKIVTETFNIPEDNIYYFYFEGSDNIDFEVTITPKISNFKANSVEINLISPAKTKSTLVEANNTLSVKDSYFNTRLLSKNFLDENTTGVWILNIRSIDPNNYFKVNSASLIIRGH